MDSYQPIYDAVRSRISNADIGEAVERAFRDANISHYIECAFTVVGYEFANAAAVQQRALRRQGGSMSDDRRACNGYPTISHADMEECAECGKKVAWDLTEHPLFGFQTCEKRAAKEGASGTNSETVAAMALDTINERTP